MEQPASNDLCVIPARGGSVRLPRKNIIEFAGKPMIQHAIKLAQDSSLFREIIVSTDDDEIQDIAASAGANVYRRRTDDGTRGTQDVGAEVLKWVPWVERMCILYATTPLLWPGDLQRARRLLMRNGDSAFCFAVGAKPLRDAGAFYWGHARYFAMRSPLVSANSVLYVLPEEQVCDINTPADLERARELYAKVKGRMA